MDFRSCIEHAERAGRLVHARGPLQRVVSACRTARENHPRATLFENASGMAAACSVVSRDALEAAAGRPAQGLERAVCAAMNSRTDRLTRADPAFSPMSGGFDRLPVFTYFDGDGGPYVTGATFFVTDPALGPNVSWHRMMVLSDSRAAVRVVEGRGLHNAIISSGGTLRAAVCIGAPVQVMAAAAMPLPPGKNELGVAAALAPTETAEVEGFVLPARTQIVIIGRFTGETAGEGPFVDITGTRDFVRIQPVFEIEKLFAMPDPVFHAVVPAGPEHRFLMGFPREAAIFDAVGKICDVAAVRLTPGGCGWLHAVVSIRPEPGFDPMEAGRAALEAHQSVKHVVVVDDDIDPGNPEQVEWAVATRFQADSDLKVLSGQPSSSLDPSALHETGKKSRSAKMILDATMKARGGPFGRVS